MTLARAEYIALRLIRRFVFSDRLLLRYGHLLPYYRPNLNQTDPAPAVATWLRALAQFGLAPGPDRSVLEVGSGATHSTLYALQASNVAGAAGRLYAYEPYAEFDAAADGRLRARFLGNAENRVERVAALEDLADGSVDLILSNSVIEHVRDPGRLFSGLGRILAPEGVMVHAIDYRDHFFKYPYHFLTFSQHVWERWLDPGDLPRWRLPDTLAAIRHAGLRVQALEREVLADDFESIRPHIVGFDAADPDTAVSGAVIAVFRPALDGRRAVDSALRGDAS